MGIVALLGWVAFVAVGCGSDSGADEQQQQEVRQRTALEAKREQRQLRRQEVRERREAMRRRAKARAREVERAREEQRAQEEAEEEAQEAEASECDPNYSGACLDPYASDYDCEGGSGDGPYYTGPVTVVGSDHYDLDRDGDGYACE